MFKASSFKKKKGSKKPSFTITTKQVNLEEGKSHSEMAYPNDDNGSGKISLGRTMIDCKLLFKLEYDSRIEDQTCTLVLSSENREVDREEEKKQTLEEGTPIRLRTFLDEIHNLIARTNAELFMDPDQISEE